MALIDKGNKAEIEGDSNIVIQGSGDNTFNINNIQHIDLSQFETKLKEILGQEFVTILVLSTDSKQIETIQHQALPFVKNRYGSTPSEWQPFNVAESILSILKEFESKSGYSVRPLFMDWRKVKIDAEKRRAIKDRRQKIILIVDVFALDFMGNLELARLFNEPEIGGCLVPICKTLNPEIAQYAQQKVNNIFDDLADYAFSYSKHVSNCTINKGYLQFDLQVSDKDALFRRLTHIVAFCQNIKPIITAPVFNTLLMAEEMPELTN
jgi:hypothetical protein